MPATRLNSFHQRQWLDIERQPNVDEMVRVFIYWNVSVFDGTKDKWFEGLDELGNDRNQSLVVDENRFALGMRTLLGDGARQKPSRREFFLAAHLAYAWARGENLRTKRTILYHMHSPEAYEGVARALEDFPSMKGIGTTREPVRSLLSYLRKNKSVARAWGQLERASDEGQVLTGGFQAVYRHQLVGFKVLREQFPWLRWEQVRLEDLHARPDSTVAKLAEFVGIENHPALMKSTFGGLPYWGDKMANQRQNGFGIGQANYELADTDAFDSLDTWVLRGLLGRAVDEGQYGRTTWLQRTLAPLVACLPTGMERKVFQHVAGEEGACSYRARRVVVQWLERASWTARWAARSALPTWIRQRLAPPVPKPLGLKPPSSPAAPANDRPFSPYATTALGVQAARG